MIYCQWIGAGERCGNSATAGHYCNEHHDRMYETFYPEMADYILEKESKDTNKGAIISQMVR